MYDNIIESLETQSIFLFTITSTIKLSPLTVATAKERAMVSK